MAAGSLVKAYPILMFIHCLVVGYPAPQVPDLLTSRSITPFQNDVTTYISKIQSFEVPAWTFLAVYWLWCAGELGDALALLEKYDAHQPLLNGWHRATRMALLAGIRLDLAAQLEPELAEQLLHETEGRIEELIKILPKPGAEGTPATMASIDLGRLYLRLAQVRQRIGAPNRAIAAAAHLAREYAQRARDEEVISWLDRLFPHPRKR